MKMDKDKENITLTAKIPLGGFGRLKIDPDEMKKALEDYREKYVNQGTAYGVIEVGDDYSTITPLKNIENISHKIESIEIVDADAIATINVLDTPKGKVLRQILEAHYPMCAVPRMSGHIADDGHTVDVIDSLYTFDIVPSKDLYDEIYDSEEDKQKKEEAIKKLRETYNIVWDPWDPNANDVCDDNKPTDL